ncbi:hypothetical protein GWN42_32915 [candidate division KSB1 bacterium]|nr:hypothetical protein [candidate division KSB1 bacterium]
MGQKELLLTLGAIAMFSIASLSINQLAGKNSEAVYGQQATLFVTKVAQRFIEQAKLKAFDETTVIGTPPVLPDDFSATLGPDSESYPNFDDMDDYHGLDRTSSTSMGDVRVTITVIYVQDSDLDTPALSPPTFYKKMTVTAQSAYLPQPVTAQYVFTFQKNE